MQPTVTDYKKLFSELILKQMITLGPAITLAKVNNVPGLSVNNKGEVLELEGDPHEILQNLIRQFVELSGAIVKKTMESILTAYPEIRENIEANSDITTQEAPVATTNVDEQFHLTENPAPLVGNNENPKQAVGMDVSEPPIEPTIPSEPKPEIPAQNAQAPKNLVSDFSSKEMEELNKALEELSNSPISNKPEPTKNS